MSKMECFSALYGAHPGSVFSQAGHHFVTKRVIVFLTYPLIMILGTKVIFNYLYYEKALICFPFYMQKEGQSFP